MQLFAFTHTRINKKKINESHKQTPPIMKDKH